MQIIGQSDYGVGMDGCRHDDVARNFLKLVKVPQDRPDLALLTKLTRAFARFPYENLTKILRAHEFAEAERRMRMPGIVLADHMELGAGGTCFSLTYFFEQVLRFAGFELVPVFCDRSYGPATHCALIARAGADRYLVDPGYLLEAPLLVPPRGESVQQAPTLVVRLVRLGTTRQLLLFTEREGVRKLRYRLRDEAVSPETFRQRWIDSFDWAMMRHLCVSQLVDGTQLYVRDGVMRKMRREGQRQEAAHAELAQKIERSFGISPGLVDAARDCLAKNAERYRFEKRGTLWTPHPPSPSSAS